MRWSTRLAVSLGAVALAFGAMLGSCGPSTGSSHGGGSGGTGGGGSGGTGGAGANGGGGSSGSGCMGLQCQQMDCGAQPPTTLTGKVFAPNGTLPLFNAIVYIPNSTPAAFTDGVTCDRCNGNVSGDPISITTTDSSGSFTLTNVPVGSNIPLVIQLGKWRVQKTIPSVPACTSTALDAATTSLPKNHTLGDIPKMAIVTGSADPLECLLLKIGIDASEINEPGGPGRISFYQGHNKPGTTMSNNTPDGTMLYGSATELMKYDVVMLPCEGGSYDQSAGTANIASYVNAGGRVFTTHYSYDWWSYAGSPFLKVAKPLNANGLWPVGQGDYYDYTISGVINTMFPKGAAFAAWLIAAGATSPMGTLGIIQGRHDLTGIDPMYAQDWINFDFNTQPPGAPSNIMGGAGVMHMTFNTPLDAPKDDMGVPLYCGRAVFSDFHVTADALNAGQTVFPGACKSAPLTDQEKALAFMLFDLSSCVQSDQTNPIP